MQVAGPYNVLGGIRRLLPKSLPFLAGGTVSGIEWYMDDLPVTPPHPQGQPRGNPHGIFRILSAQPRNAVAAQPDEPYRLVLTDQVDTIAFEEGTLSYEVTQQDVASVTTVTGTLDGVEDHVFVPTTDYTFTRKTIEWTGTGDVPDDGTDVEYAYKHRLYRERLAMDSRIIVRATIKAQRYKPSADEYPAPMFVAILGDSLGMKLRSMAANHIVRPASPDEPYTETMTVGRVLAAGPLPPATDPSGQWHAWFVDFTLNVAAIYEGDLVPAILEVPFEVDILP